MAYKRQTFVDDQVLEAEHLNHIEIGLETVSNELSNLNSIPTFDTFPSVEIVKSMTNNSYFKTNGFYSKGDGAGCIYQVKDSLASGDNYYIRHGSDGKYIRPACVGQHNRDILVDWYGVRRYYSDKESDYRAYAIKNSEIMNALASVLQNGFTLRFASGHYFFRHPIPHMDRHIMLKGVCTNACVVNAAVNYGSFLHFPYLADKEVAISILGGVIQDLGIIGNPSTCDVNIHRKNSVTDNDSVVEVTGGSAITYGIKAGRWDESAQEVKAWGHTIQNVRLRNLTYGIHMETENALISGVDAHQCKIGVSVGNDVKVTDVQAWNCMVGVQLRGALASATNIRGDSIGKHLIECWQGKCTLTNIDGDFCFGSLIHYGDGNKRYMHLGQAIGCMGRVATKTAFARSEEFDLREIDEADYEYCSYISIAPNTQVFGGSIEVANVKANIFDSNSEYVHPDALISIGVGSTVKGVIIKGSVPYDADIEYFNSHVIRNKSEYAEVENNTAGYVTDFDGITVEDINFITPLGFIRSKRRSTALDRVLEFSKDANGAVLYSEQTLTDAQKAQVRANVGLDNISSLAFVESEDDCIDSIKTYVLSDGRMFGSKIEVIEHFTNHLDDAGYEWGFFRGGAIDSSNTSPWYVTGFIPVKIGQTVEFVNLKFLEMNHNYGTKSQFYFYDENKTEVTHSGMYSPENYPSAAWNAQLDSEGNIVKVTIPTAYSSSVRYMRFCARYIGPESIVAVEEDIKDPTIESVFGSTGLRVITDSEYATFSSLVGRVSALEGIINAQ